MRLATGNCAETCTLVKMRGVPLPQKTAKRVKTWSEKRLRMQWPSPQRPAQTKGLETFLTNSTSPSGRYPASPAWSRTCCAFGRRSSLCFVPSRANQDIGGIAGKTSGWFSRSNDCSTSRDLRSRALGTTSQRRNAPARNPRRPAGDKLACLSPRHPVPLSGAFAGSWMKS